MTTTTPPRPLQPRPLQRRLLAAGVVALPLLALVIAAIVVAPSAPESLPSHFGADGRADGWANTGSYLLAVKIACAAFSAITVVGVVRLRSQFATTWLVVGAAFTNGLIATIWFASLLSARAQPDPSQQRLGAGLITVLAVSLGLAMLAYWAHGRPQAPAETVAAPLAKDSALAQEVTADDQAASFEQIHSKLLAIVALGPLLAFLIPAILMFRQYPWAGAGIALAGLVMAWFVLGLAFVTVTAGPSGLQVRSKLGFTVFRAPLHTITSAHATQIDPMEWGGWGLRWLPGRYAYVVGAGPGLVVSHRHGRKFAITLADPDTPARVIASQLAAQRNQAPGQ